MPVQSEAVLGSGYVVIKDKPRLIKFAKYLAVIGVIILIISIAPKAWFEAKSYLGYTASENIYATASESSISNLSEREYLPEFDSSLPIANSLIIPTIGVNTEIRESSLDEYEKALKNGVWRVTNFGTPRSVGSPIILAAHRFGYLRWTNQYRHENSFFNLPKLEVGDTVEIVWNQRKYVYGIYASDEGTEITDYSADLILYTCNDLTSDIRIFKYARLLEI